MATKTYTVHRSMHGDGRDYEPGDTRELMEADAADLVESGALSLVGEEPAVRQPRVRNTFGTAEATGHTETIGASTGKAIDLTSASPKKAAKSADA